MSDRPTPRTDEDGTERLCRALYGRAPIAADYVGGSQAKMLHEAAETIVELRQELEQFERELAESRALFPKILEALGNGSACAPDASMEFVRLIPAEVSRVVGELRAECERLREALVSLVAAVDGYAKVGIMAGREAAMRIARKALAGKEGA